MKENTVYRSYYIHIYDSCVNACAHEGMASKLEKNGITTDRQKLVDTPGVWGENNGHLINEAHLHHP